MIQAFRDLFNIQQRCAAQCDYADDACYWRVIREVRDEFTDRMVIPILIIGTIGGLALAVVVIRMTSL